MTIQTTAENGIECDVVIIGGGLAGLTCAIGLGREGLRVTVVEREPILGGRARSWTDATTGDPVHIGPHIFLNQYPNMWQFLDLLQTRHRIVWQPDERFITMADGNQSVVIRGSRLPAPASFLPSLLNDKHNQLLDVSSNFWVVQTAIDLDEDAVMRLDQVNAYAFLRSAGVSQRFIRRFWEFTSMAIMNVPLELCSAGALLRFFRHLIGHQQLTIGFPSCGLGDLFAPQARALIENQGGRVLSNTLVSGFLGTPEKVTGVVLADGRQITARHCVAALPPQALRQLARREWMDRHRVFSDLGYFMPVPYVSIYLWLDRKLTTLPFWARTYAPHDLNCDFYDLSNIYAGWEGRNSLIASNIIYSHRADGLSDEELVQGTMRELTQFLPQAEQAKVLHQAVHHIPMAIHGPFPGTERRRPLPQTPIGGLVLAGDWIQTRFPSSMESAVASGFMAAEQVLAERGQPRKLVAAMPEPDGLMYLLHRMGQRMPMKRLLHSEALMRRLPEAGNFAKEENGSKAPMPRFRPFNALPPLVSTALRRFVSGKPAAPYTRGR